MIKYYTTGTNFATISAEFLNPNSRGYELLNRLVKALDCNAHTQNVKQLGRKDKKNGVDNTERQVEHVSTSVINNRTNVVYKCVNDESRKHCVTDWDEMLVDKYPDSITISILNTDSNDVQFLIEKSESVDIDEIWKELIKDLL